MSKVKTYDDALIALFVNEQLTSKVSGLYLTEANRVAEIGRFRLA